jgi:hypothetical protein
MIGCQSNNGIGMSPRSGWHGDRRIERLACLQHTETYNQEFVHRRDDDLFGLEAARLLLRRATRAGTAGLKRIADSAGM